MTSLLPSPTIVLKRSEVKLQVFIKRCVLACPERAGQLDKRKKTYSTCFEEAQFTKKNYRKHFVVKFAQTFGDFKDPPKNKAKLGLFFFLFCEHSFPLKTFLITLLSSLKK